MFALMIQIRMQVSAQVCSKILRLFLPSLRHFPFQVVFRPLFMSFESLSLRSAMFAPVFSTLLISLFSSTLKCCLEKTIIPSN